MNFSDEEIIAQILIVKENKLLRKNKLNELPVNQDILNYATTKLPKTKQEELWNKADKKFNEFADTKRYEDMGVKESKNSSEVNQSKLKDDNATKNKRKKQNDSKNEQYTSKILTENFFIEQVYSEDPIEISKFCVYNLKTEDIEYKDSFKHNGITYYPIKDEEIIKKIILLPTKAEEYGTDEDLDKELKEFIIKWLDVPEDILQFAIWNIKRSWVYERFHTLNYLRALGDTGMGKTRFLDTLGLLHYKPIPTSGASTAAPIFRIIEKWRGTLIVDEGDFTKSDESQDIIKIINLGYEKGKQIMRCEQNNSTKINFFDPFCPKILATRKTFTDKATESRCITHVLRGTIRQDIKWNLNEDFWRESQVLRNKLLMWRFKNYNKINPEEIGDVNIVELEPRMKQIALSFVSLFTYNKKSLEIFKEFIKNRQEEIIDERRNSFYGEILIAIKKLLDEGQEDICAKDIIEAGELTDYKGNLMKPRSLNSKLKELGFEKSEKKRFDGKWKRVIPIKRQNINYLFKRYGLDVDSVDGRDDCYGDKNFLTKAKNYEKKGEDKKTSFLTVTTVSNVHTVSKKEIIDLLEKGLRSGTLVNKELILNNFGPKGIDIIIQLIKEGLVFEPKKDKFSLLHSENEEKI